MASFREFFVQATDGRAPYPYQVALAEQGFPEIVSVETGAGKTAAVVLAWLWRRLQADNTTPRRLVLCEPMRTLVDQCASQVSTWLDRLGLSERVSVHVMMGGDGPRDTGAWRLDPAQPSVVIGTLDMLVSRALNRGYAMGRYYWQLDFALLNNDAQWVFDEIQLMGPALATSRQLDGFRRKFGTALPVRSTWMSATVDIPALSTVDNSEVGETLVLGEADRSFAELRERLEAGRLITRVEVDAGRREQSIARSALAWHEPGTLTLIIMNTVHGAQDVFEALARSAPPTEVALLHSRYRPRDRQANLAKALSAIDRDGPGRIVVSTQVVEAGVDISAANLVTEVAPWPSIVQRAGRCNRDGKAGKARFAWAPVDTRDRKSSPYEPSDLQASQRCLEALEGQSLTSTELRHQAVDALRPVQQVLRGRDLLQLFDTAPDASGNDIDVSPYIRVGDDIDFYVAWRALDGQPPPEATRVAAVELCPVPLGRQVRDMVTSMWQSDGRPLAWRFDHLSGEWARLHPQDLRPGLVVLLDSGVGGYDALRGWLPSSRREVPPVYSETSADDNVAATPEEAVGDDGRTNSPEPVELSQHLVDAREQAEKLSADLGPLDLDPALTEAAITAAALHDIGKAHRVFQSSLQRANPHLDPGRIWAKSGTHGRLAHDPPAFRHEWAGALALTGAARPVLVASAEKDLVAYLVASHHGRVRMGARSIPGKEREGSLLGVRDGDVLAVAGLSGDWQDVQLSLSPAQLGRSADGEPSWSERAVSLLARSDLGPFRLAFLEAVVVLADWRASAMADTRP